MRSTNYFISSISSISAYCYSKTLTILLTLLIMVGMASPIVAAGEPSFFPLTRLTQRESMMLHFINVFSPDAAPIISVAKYFEGGADVYRSYIRLGFQYTEQMGSRASEFGKLRDDNLKMALVLTGVNQPNEAQYYLGKAAAYKDLIVLVLAVPVEVLIANDKDVSDRALFESNPSLRLTVDQK